LIAIEGVNAVIRDLKYLQQKNSCSHYQHVPAFMESFLGW